MWSNSVYSQILRLNSPLFPLGIVFYGRFFHFVIVRLILLSLMLALRIQPWNEGLGSCGVDYRLLHFTLVLFSRLCLCHVCQIPVPLEGSLSDSGVFIIFKQNIWKGKGHKAKEDSKGSNMHTHRPVLAVSHSSGCALFQVSGQRKLFSLTSSPDSHLRCTKNLSQPPFK